MTTEVDTSFLHLAGSKLKRKLGGQLNESAGSAMPQFAKAQLEKLGWKEGEGLGKRRQGMNSHIKVVKRADGLGLGQSTVDPAFDQSLQANDWWKNSLGSTLAKLSSKQKKKKSKKESTVKVYTDEELFKATGGARFGMRAQTQQHAKWKRAESNISEQDEIEAQKKVEWDGTTAPKVILSESSKKNKSKDDETAEELAERKRQKKEKKKRKRMEEEEAAFVTDEGSSKKKAKKSKKSKSE